MSKGKHRGPRAKILSGETRFMWSILFLLYGAGMLAVVALGSYECSQPHNTCIEGYQDRSWWIGVPGAVLFLMGCKGWRSYWKELKHD